MSSDSDSMDTVQDPRTAALAGARSLLFVPGNRPERFDKALHSGADAVVLDLEDAVAGADKPQARAAIAAALARWTAAAPPVPVVVRINAVGSAAGDADLAWLAAIAPPDGVLLPKAESAAQVAAVLRAMPGGGGAVLPLVETAAGFAALPGVAAAPGVLRLVVGHLDFMADTGISCADDEHELDALRFHVAVQTRLQRLAAAVDGVTAAFNDDDRLRRDTQRALRFGFGAKLCIHPRQVALVHDTLRPGDAELAWAQRVLAADAAAAGAAVQLDGQMVDLPVVLRARRTLRRAGLT